MGCGPRPGGLVSQAGAVRLHRRHFPAGVAPDPALLEEALDGLLTDPRCGPARRDRHAP